MTETTEFWKKHNYELVETSDQSPTLRWLASETQETMHHRGGAYSETQQIYGNPLRVSLTGGGRSAVSVGLGLGYNEILVAIEALKNQVAPGNFRLLSYESDPFLHFLTWVQNTETEYVYDEIFQFFNESNKPEAKNWLRESFKLGAWKLEGALLEDFSLSETYELILYDAFSAKTSPHLWQEEFLSRFFEVACSAKSQISTYACMGPLKRALRKNGFQLVIRDGFQSKRNSTLGIRGFDSGL
jgi:tRNA U34 5-methylaminomethyl-2-thiouridine-forming methyltransferase MnmC